MNKLFITFALCLTAWLSYSQDTIVIASEQRLIIPISINGSKEFALVDTGSTLNIINSDELKRLKLSKGFLIGDLNSRYSKEALYSLKNCKTIIGGRFYMQFGTSDISSAVNAIYDETGIEVVGILGTPAIRQLGMIINLPGGIVTIKNEPNNLADK